MTNPNSLILPPTWAEQLPHVMRNPIWQKLAENITAERAAYTVYPPHDQLFAALQATDPTEVKVVILGQDPYHGENQAHGLSFSVPQGQKLPPSLRNIYRELADDLGEEPPTHGDLSHWTQQGVLLLNAVLSVRAGQAASHRGLGWEFVTSAVIDWLDARQDPCAFVLWGSDAQKKAPKNSQHLVLRSVHPSPLSAYRGFFGSRPFSQINQWLIAQEKSPIQWKTS